MDRAERRRHVRGYTEPGTAECLGCKSSLGRRGTPPAEKFELLSGYVHRDQDCRAAALRLYLVASGRI